MKEAIQSIFSVKNSPDKIHKIWTIAGIKLKFKKTQPNIATPAENNDDYRFIELNKQYFKVKNHWVWDEYDKQGWEPQTYNTYKYFLTSKTSYVDIGAWVGITIFYAAELGAKEIYAIEANPLSYKLVKENCLINKITQNAKLDNICITDKDNTTVGFGGYDNKINTSSSSSIRGDKWQIPSKKLITYLKENNLLECDDLFIKIDIEGAEELILNDLKQLQQNKNAVIYLSIHPNFVNNKNKFCENILQLCQGYKNIFDSNLNPLSRESLKEMILTNEKYPSWGTRIGNFFEITLSNK